MQKKQKKGFTIVELVVVIAVIAILAAVLIPTFANLIHKAEFNNDQALVRNLNTTLAISAEGTDGKPTMYDTLKDVKDNGGFIVETLTPRSSGSDIVWDQEHNQFVLVYDNGTKFFTGTQWNKNLNKSKMWKIVSEVPATSEYSLYLRNGFTGTTVNANGFGVDVGDNEGITAVNYTNEGSAKDVVIRTNSANTNLTIDDASTGTINHYGSAGELNIIQCHTASYHENGNVAFAEISKGRIVLENGSKIDHIHVNKKHNVEEFDTVIIKDNGAKALPEAITRDQVDVSVAKPVVTVESGSTSETVYVYPYTDSESTKTGTTEQTATQNTTIVSALGQLVLDNGSDAGEKAMSNNQKEEAKTEVVDTAVEKEDLASEENATARYWIDIAADEFAGGTGKESDPYLISSARQLALLSEIMAGYNTEKSYANYCDKYYKLTKDIDLNGKIWISIGIGNDGNGINPFKGHIDGNNKTVYNMSSLDATYEELEAHKMGTWSAALGNTVAQDGFVGYAKDASVKNLYIVGAVFENSKFEKSGFIVCCADGNIVLENCHVDSTSRYYGKSNIGGLVGLYKVPGENGLILKNCSSAASITLTSSRGAGFVGALYKGTKMFATDCTFSGTISGDRLGGFIGRSTSSYADLSEGCHFKNCHMLGTLTPNTAGDYGYVEAWQADSTPYITLDGCTYKDATDGMVKAFALTDAHIFGYIEGFHTSAWFGVDGVMCENSEVFENGEFVYEIDFTTNKFTYTVNEGMLIIIQRNICDFANTSFVGSDGVTFTLQRWGDNDNFNFVNNTQFYDADGNLLDGEVTGGLNVGVGLNYEFAWDTTLNGWKLAA